MSLPLVIGIPPALTVIGIVLNSLYNDQPQHSLEQDPASKLAAERT